MLSLLRTALGTATAPPNSVTIALAMFLTAFVMGPVLQRSYDDGIKPLVANQIGVEEALQKASVPLRGFMQKNVREKDLKLFVDLSGEAPLYGLRRRRWLHVRVRCSARDRDHRASERSRRRRHTRTSTAVMTAAAPT